MDGTAIIQLIGSNIASLTLFAGIMWWRINRLERTIEVNQRDQADTHANMYATINQNKADIARLEGQQTPRMR